MPEGMSELLWIDIPEIGTYSKLGLDLHQRAMSDTQEPNEFLTSPATVSFGNVGWHCCNRPSHLACQTELLFVRPSAS